ncbi:aldo/keto reductase [Cocleimonas flava]|uniref:Aryl-alcohol dehydrogenase-like predicted oxidoreductase n=1 Tax=Cocleimonas flava TaxID=634765 RepID=A0A4R1EZB0_9GAMM|nr:aldo/keto reductase [Cocleimonas flava]TCJ87246.1 aryl-alcohol dehydrogenase-like predicted oxidoreductase [Cocleimonas flava]
MKKVKLGSSDLQVSEVCLGSMTWGSQNTEAEAFEQIDYALDQGINFIDTAEVYAVPPKAETQGLTETYIGNWLAANKDKREDIVLASKVCGPGISWIRDGSKITGKGLKEALDGSLKRLQTDYIDLYQLHWPNRPFPHFNRHWPQDVNYAEIDVAQEREEHLEILTALGDCVKAGKIRHCGLSDDTPWGVNEYLRLAEKHDLPKMVSIQNEFNILHLMDSPHLIETCVLNDVAYLPWSPLAGGALSGKYRNGALPPNCRWTIEQRNGIFRDTSQSHAAIEALYKVASSHNLSLTQMSLAWVYQFNGVTSSIIGATSMEQLKEDIDAYNLTLSEEVLAGIDDVIKQFPVPF